MKYSFHCLKVLHCLTSVFRPSKDVRMPRMEFRPTSLASSGSWDEYCSMSFKILAASWMVWIGAWDYGVAFAYIENEQEKYNFCYFIDHSRGILTVFVSAYMDHTCMTCCRERSQERQCCWNRSLELSFTSMDSRQSPSNLNGAHVENTQMFFHPFLQIRSPWDTVTLCQTIFSFVAVWVLTLISIWKFILLKIVCKKTLKKWLRYMHGDIASFKRFHGFDFWKFWF